MVKWKTGRIGLIAHHEAGRRSDDSPAGGGRSLDTPTLYVENNAGDGMTLRTLFRTSKGVLE
jgi:hypothetical protein